MSYALAVLGIDRSRDKSTSHSHLVKKVLGSLGIAVAHASAAYEHRADILVIRRIYVIFGVGDQILIYVLDKIVVIL